MHHSNIQRRSIFLLKMLGVAAFYALFAHISHLYVMSGGNGISVVWPSSVLALAALLGAGLLTRNGRFQPATSSLRDFLLRLILLGRVRCRHDLGPGRKYSIAGFIGSGEHFYNLLRWWIGDVLGVILITLLTLSWRKTKNTHEARAVLAFEPILLLGLTFFCWASCFPRLAPR